MYQCPNCGGGLRFDIPTQTLMCDHCQNTLQPSSLEETTKTEEEQIYQVTKFSCPQCGAEIVSADDTAAAFCSFCGSSVILESRLSEEQKPDGIIPFKISKADCIKSYMQWMKKNPYAPKELKDERFIEGFRGIYMPYWVYGTKHNGDFTLSATTQTRRGDYDITRHYHLKGHIDASYDGITHDASSAFSDDISEAAAPYHIQSMEPFHSSYLSGFYADIADTNSEQYEAETMKLANDYSYNEITSLPAFLPYHINKPGGTAHMFHPSKIPTRYALFPVWFMSYRKNDRVSYVTINGQTGKISADAPVDIKKYFLGSALLTIPVFFLFNFFMSLTAKTALGSCMVIALLALIFSLMEKSKIRSKEAIEGKSKKGKAKGSFIGAAIALIICAGIFLINPINDYHFYVGAVLAIITTFFTLIGNIRDYNFLATRKLPQFARTGGDDFV